MSAGALTMRSGCAIRSDVNVNEARIDPPAGVPIDRQPLGDTGTKVVQQDVGSLNQLVNNLLTFRALQIDLNGLLAAVVLEIHRRHAAACADGLLALRGG